MSQIQAFIILIATNSRDYNRYCAVGGVWVGAALLFFYFHCSLLYYGYYSLLLESPATLKPNIGAASLLVSHFNDMGLALIDIHVSLHLTVVDGRHLSRARFLCHCLALDELRRSNK